MKASDYQITGPVKLSERKTHEDFGKTKELEKEFLLTEQENLETLNYVRLNF